MRVRIVVTVLAAAVAACAGAFAVAAAVAGPSVRGAARAPSLVVRPRAAPQGGTVVFHGRGFPARVRLALLAGPPASEATRIGSATTDADGRFRAPIRITRDVDPGVYVGLACRHDCRLKASARFRVLAR